MTNTDHVFRINEVLSFIHRDITADLQAKKLAEIAAYSEQHFHRLFKQVVGEPVHQYVRRTRLETAANQLIFSPQLTVLEVAENCGFQSLSSFSRAFREVYNVPPGRWRLGNRDDKQRHYLSDPELHEAYQRLAQVELPTAEIVNIPACHVAYVRHLGYGRSIRQSWQMLKAWADSEGRSVDVQIGLHHSNPALVPLEQCHYVACIGIDEPVIRRGRVNSVTIPGGLHATFAVQGKFGELLPRISKIWEEWLPQSGYVARTTPAFARYTKNQFLRTDDQFDLVFYLPIGF
ncbi:AraC family transcriptional regulator [Leucothrix arctica]|uniref:AraC family transcriptional regulator n=1 Tax=Leucothrix arctica TaxID=1481894 RepID=A0A317C8M8_9GAMM|nr:GyrI-like domain-containing protein [Leucothrix arctica]PWQ94689.1 AraC family transcriptional regulator [Leucothrix arctica]